MLFQLTLPNFMPTVKTAHGKEWIWAHDSVGQGRYFSRKAGSKSLFFCPYAGPWVHPKAAWGSGEYCDELGQIIHGRE